MSFCFSYAPWFEMFYAILNNISEAEIKGNVRTLYFVYFRKLIY